MADDWNTVKSTSGDGTTFYQNGSYEEEPVTRKDGGLLGAFGMGTPDVKRYTPGYGHYQNNKIAGYESELAKRMAGVDSRMGPQAGITKLGDARQASGVSLGPAHTYGGPDLSREAESRGYQNELAKALALQAQGKGPSMAGMQMQQGMEAALAGQLAAQSSVRGRANIGMNMRGSMQNMAQMQQAAAMEAAKLKVQEQFNAQQGLAGLSSAMRSSDLGAAGLQQAGALANMAAKNQFGLQQGQMDLQTQFANQNASNQFALQQGNMDQQVALQNAQLQMQKMGLDDATIQSLMGMRIGMSEADRKAMMQFEQDRVTAATNYEKMWQEQNAAAQDRRGKFIGGLASMMTNLSDETQKVNITPADDSLKEFLSALGAHEYEYKNPDAPGAGEGKFVSPMAQELEKTELGKSMVIDTPQGKMVNYGKGFGTMLAGAANHEKRISELEAALKASSKKGKK